MDVAISGASGFIGTALGRALRARGDRVLRIVRSGPATDDAVRWAPEAGAIDAAGLEGVDAVVHLAGESIGAARWTATKKARILDSRTRGTRVLAGAVAGLRRPPAVLLSASAIGYYGDREDERLTEDSPPGTGFLASVTRRWEDAARPAADAGVRVAWLRSGIVLHPGGGALRVQLLPFRAGLGARLGSGRQWTSWISLDDEVGAILHLLDGDTGGPVNLTAPEPVTNAAYTRALGRALRRPARLAVPAFALRAAFGAEAARDVLLASQRVVPARLEASGYRWRDRGVDAALARLLQAR